MVLRGGFLWSSNFVVIYTRAMGEKTINLAFLSYPPQATDGVREKLQNMLVRYSVGRFDHVEIIFENTQRPEYIYACSVLQNGTVFFREKGFSREGYEYLTVSGLHPEAVNRMKNFCYQESVKGSTFNDSGFNRAGSPLPEMHSRSRMQNYRDSPNKWFCSQLVTAALQQGGLLEEYIAGTMTPAAIYDALVKTVATKHLHKGTNPFFSHRIHRRLKDETKRLFQGQTQKSETREKTKRGTNSNWFFR